MGPNELAIACLSLWLLTRGKDKLYVLYEGFPLKKKMSTSIMLTVCCHQAHTLHLFLSYIIFVTKALMDLKLFFSECLQ